MNVSEKTNKKLRNIELCSTGFNRVLEESPLYGVTWSSYEVLLIHRGRQQMKQPSALISQVNIFAFDKCTTERNNNFITLKEYMWLMKVQTTFSHSAVYNSIWNQNPQTNLLCIHTGEVCNIIGDWITVGFWSPAALCINLEHSGPSRQVLQFPVNLLCTVIFQYYVILPNDLSETVDMLVKTMLQVVRYSSCNYDVELRLGKHNSHIDTTTGMRKARPTSRKRHLKSAY